MLSAVKAFFATYKMTTFAVGAALILGALFWLRHDAYNDGIADRDAEIVAANLELERKLNEAEDIADTFVLEAEIQHNRKVQAELEKIDEAKASGSSPFDAIYPVGM